MDKEEKHLEEYKLHMNNCATTSNIMLQQVIDFSNLVLKGTFIINGSAAIAMLTLFTKALIEKPELSNTLLNSTSYFAYGALTAVIASSIAYITQQFFLYALGNSSNGIINHVFSNHSLERKNLRINEFNNSSNNDEKIKIQKYINSEDKYYQDRVKDISIFKIKEKKWNRWAEFFRIISYILIAISFYLFFLGISETKNAFISQNNSTEIKINNK